MRKIQNSKFKVQNYNSKFKILIFISLLTLHFALLTSTAIAADSTPSADIKTKLEELKKEIASKAAKLKQEVNRKLKDKAYVGEVKSKSTQSLTLAAKSGAKMVSINQDTIFESRVKNKKYSFKVLTEEDFIAALGDIDETGVLTAKKIILLDPQPYTLYPKTFLWGQIIAISDKLLTLKDRDSKKVAVSLPNPSLVKLNEFVILTGSKNKNNIFSAEFVYVVPQGGIIKPKKIATPSAKVASPSAKPKPKKAS